MATVQHVRPYSQDELVTFNRQIEAIFTQHPEIVAMTVLAVELKCLLQDDPENPCPVKPPREIAALLASLEAAIPFLVNACRLGLTTEESVS